MTRDERQAVKDGALFTGFSIEVAVMGWMIVGSHGSDLVFALCAAAFVASTVWLLNYVLAGRGGF